MTKKLIYSLLVLLCALSVSCTKDDENQVAAEGDAVTLTIDGKNTKLYVYLAENTLARNQFAFGLSDTPEDDDDDSISMEGSRIPLQIGKDVAEYILYYNDKMYKIASGNVKVANLDAANRTVTLEFDGIWKTYDGMMVTIKGIVTFKYTETGV